jgi:hypothetical protein
MTRAKRLLMGVALAGLASCTVYAQDESDDDPRVNSNLGMTITEPVNPMGRYANLGAGIGGGVGYNFTRRHGVLAEFMWNGLSATSEALNPIRSAVQDNSINGTTNLYTVSGNYRFELRGNRLGAYLIGGGGLYYRKTYLTKGVTSPSGVPCSRSWLWYGFSCVAGMVVPNQTISSSGSNAFGFNGGIGFTVRVGPAPYRMYAESRYHYAPNDHISTQMVTVAVGIRY